MKDNRGGVWSFNGDGYAKRAALGGASGGVEHGFECVFHVGGGERSTIVKMNS
jgi:hypothetical protein